MLFSCGIAFAQVQRKPTPLPPEPAQNSPFPLGQEPKLTHTVKVYWTTIDGLVTNITVTADDSRPTQIYCDRSSIDKNVQLFSTISPRCNYNIRLSATKSSKEDERGLTTWKALGDGTVTIKVHGFEEKDYSRPPKVIVQYLRDGKIVGESSTAEER